MTGMAGGVAFIYRDGLSNVQAGINGLGDETC